MRIVHIITRFIRGGADENTLITCNGQAALGHDVTLICGHAYDPEMLKNIDPRVKTVIIEPLTREISPLSDLACYKQLNAYLKTHKPDIVHTHESKAGIIGRLAARSAKIDYIVHGVHILAFMNTEGLRKKIYIMLEKLAGQFTDAFLHVSPAMREQCKRNNIGKNALHQIIPSGMVLDKYRHAAASEFKNVDLPNLNAITSDTKFLIMSGTLEKRKRVKDFLKIFERILIQYPNLMLMIAGDGAERAAIEEEARALGVDNHIIMLGYTADLEEYIAKADIGVHAALHEGLPRVVLQYIAAGKPVAMTHLEGIDFVVKDGENGHIVDDINELEEKIVSMLTSDQSYRFLADGAKATDLSKWDHQTMVDGIENTYTKVFEKAQNTAMRA